MKKKHDFPMDGTVAAACNRAEVILDLYKKAGCAENWQERRRAGDGLYDEVLL